MIKQEEYHIYPEKLEQYIRSSKLVPRKIRDAEHLKLFHRYWISSFNDIIKVEDIFVTGGSEYYTIRYNPRMYACISYPLLSDSCYELLHNKENIENNKLINGNISYTGAEIKYWFILNNIDFDNNKFSGFWSFLNPDSDNLLIDNKYYFVSYDKRRKQKCQVILDKSKL